MGEQVVRGDAAKDELDEVAVGLARGRRVSQ